MNLNTGDKVAFLNDPLRGEVVKKLDKNRVLLRLDDGFEIPANINELVLVEIAVQNQTKPNQVMEHAMTMEEIQVAGIEGVYIGFYINEGNKVLKPEVNICLINASQKDISFALFISSAGHSRGIATDTVSAAEAVKVFSYPLDMADEYRNWQIHILHFDKKQTEIIQPWSVPFKIRPAMLLKDKHPLPMTGQEGLLIEIKPQDGKTSINNNIYKPDPTINPFTHVDQVGEVVDLHIEELVPNTANLSADAIFTIQIDHFRNAMEKAHAFGMEKIVFIHGIGNGRLKKEIRFLMARDPHIKRFEDADIKKFGYGATSVYLKST